jgi:hypothetical protein
VKRLARQASERAHVTMSDMPTWLIRPVFLVAALTMGGALGCNSDTATVNKAAVEAAKASGAGEDALLQRRDALLNSRRKLREKQQALVEERLQVIATGGDPSEVDKKVSELSEEEVKLGESEAQLNQDFEGLFAKQRALLQTLASSGDESAQVTAREVGLASREKSLTLREDRLGQREAALAERERQLAIRERETCRTPAAAPTIIQPPSPQSTRYRRKDVESVLQRARRNMSKHGILRTDLPAPAQKLEQEATKAMGKGDYGQAYFAASQLLATVDTTKVNRAFIQAKFERLNGVMRGTKLNSTTQSKVEKLFQEASESYGDQKYSTTNKRLNKIFAIVQ